MVGMKMKTLSFLLTLLLLLTFAMDAKGQYPKLEELIINLGAFAPASFILE